MRDRTEQFLRGACLALAVLLIMLLLRAGCRAGALVGAKIPPVPTLITHAETATNSPTLTDMKDSASKPLAATNRVNAVLASNSPMQRVTNGNTPQVSKAISSNGLNTLTTWINTNLTAQGTNRLPIGVTNGQPTNTAVKKIRRTFPPGGMNFGGVPGRPGGRAPLPAEIQTRVDKIVESEMFAPVFHPQPMALLGIAGETAFLQTPSGQTGLLTVTNEPLDGIKLLRIGINRVLVEQDGEKKELMIFDGYGGESLMPKENSK